MFWRPVLLVTGGLARCDTVSIVRFNLDILIRETDGAEAQPLAREEV